MRPIPLLAAFLAALLSSPTPLWAAPGDGSLKVQSHLTRPDAAPAPEATGRVRMHAHDDHDHFSVEVKDVDGSVAHDLLMHDGDGFVFVAALSGSGSKLEYEVDTGDGDALPLGADSLDDLLGRRVRIQADGELVLEGYTPGALPGVKETRSGMNALTRPDPAPNDGATGHVAVRTTPAQGENDFGVRVQDADASLVHELFVENSEGDLEFVAELDGGGDADPDPESETDYKYKVETKKGDALPLGADDVEDLLGRRVEVRRGDGSVVLWGAFPADFDGKDKVRIDLSRPDSAPDGDATGRAEVKRKPHKPWDQKFEVKGDHLSTHADFAVYLEDAADSDAMVFVGNMKGHDDDHDDGDGGEIEDTDLESVVRMKDGQSLPLGVAHVDALAGRRVEIRAGGEVVLEGVVPGAEDIVKAKVKLEMDLCEGTPDFDARGRLTLSSKPGDERFEVKVMKLDFSETDYHVWVETDEDAGEYEDAGRIEQKGKSHVGFLRLRTKDGDPLPQDVESVTDLGLRRVEVRDDDGICYLETLIPEFGEQPDPDPDPAPVIDLDPASFSFGAVEGGPNPAGQALTITNSGDAALSWTAGDDAPWLSLSAVSGNVEPGESDTVDLVVDITGLAAGDYAATVSVDDPAAGNGPQEASVSLTVEADGGPGPTTELVIDFEDKLADGTVQPDSDAEVGDLVSGGFLFDVSNDDGNLANGELGDFQGEELTYNGTTWFYVFGFFDGGWQFPVTTVSPVGGGTFALKSLQLSEGCFCANAEIVRITANFAGGGSEFQDVVLDLFLDGNTPPDEPDDDFQTAVFPDTWVELESFTIQTVGGFAQGEWVVDNIVVEVPTAP